VLPNYEMAPLELNKRKINVMKSWNGVLSVYDLALKLHISVNVIMKFICTLSKCIMFIYICVGVNVECETCKCKNV